MCAYKKRRTYNIVFYRIKPENTKCVRTIILRIRTSSSSSYGYYTIFIILFVCVNHLGLFFSTLSRKPRNYYCSAYMVRCAIAAAFVPIKTYPTSVTTGRRTAIRNVRNMLENRNKTYGRANSIESENEIKWTFNFKLCFQARCVGLCRVKSNHCWPVINIQTIRPDICLRIMSKIIEISTLSVACTNIVEEPARE